jgi:hypothetical protein
VVAVAVSVLSISPQGTADTSAAATRQSSRTARGTEAHFMQGGQFFEHPTPKPAEHEQFSPVKLPTGPSRIRTKQRASTVGNFRQIGLRGPAGLVPQVTLSMPNNTPFAVPTNNDPVDPSEASAGDKVVYATNEYIAFSVDSGATFVSFDPGSLYSDFPDGGRCCDQIVQYVPSIDRFVWLDQYWGDLGGTAGKNRYRLAVFPPAAVTAAGLAFWTYWDIKASSFPALTLPFLDYPDLAIGQTYLYLSANNGKNGGVSASVIARIGLDNLQMGLNLAAGPHAWRYVNGALFLGRVAQNTGSRAFWAKNITTSSLQVSYWDESSIFWFGPAVISIFSWPNTGYSTSTPDGKNWLNLYQGQILASARFQNHLWLAWTAGRGTNKLAWLNQPHVELVDINTSSLTLTSQRVIWNPNYVFAYPNLNVNPIGQLGVALAWGGNGRWVNLAVGNLTVSPFLVWNTTSSNANCGCSRWGDYLAIRPANTGDRRAFSVAGYGTNTSPTGGGGTVYDTHYVRFSVSP